MYFTSLFIFSVYMYLLKKRCLHRTCFFLIFSVYPLKERCLQYLTQIVKQENIVDLDLPRSIQTDLEDKFDSFKRRNTPS